MKLAVVCLLLSLTLVSADVLSEEIVIPVGQQGNNELTLPANGQTQLEVLTAFGEPASESMPIGDPAISKWHYEHFIVVFEEDRVLSAVRKVESE
ncbi:hypothetical protein [Umboniibacter marinipuniceus]|uniref:SmpA/OmlA family protein n=1 Tax=Umboniibacter marinipuniceus TaxID=569599 RepID=A0A3M0A7W4_9GAMM|nr:hypothetical protein [Umboniibacter marinipuniceus]RMA81163.1 hypothetical protein DFR27_0961 [Umboniibacter marinipuniceus]